MRETNDGFRIAEEDLRLRGPGEILGTRQSGEQGFRVASPEDVAELAPVAQGDARLLLDRDGGLAGERGQAARLCLYLFERDAAVGLLRSGVSSPCFFLPRLTFAGATTTSRGSLTASPSTLTAPSAILRFASPFEAAKPSPVSAATMSIPPLDLEASANPRRRRPRRCPWRSLPRSPQPPRHAASRSRHWPARSSPR